MRASELVRLLSELIDDYHTDPLIEIETDARRVNHRLGPYWDIESEPALFPQLKRDYDRNIVIIRKSKV